MENEIDKIEKNETRVLLKNSKEKDITGLKWIYKIK